MGGGDLGHRVLVDAMQAHQRVESLMLRSDHVLVGREDLVKLTGLTEERAQLDYLYALGLPSVVLKLGARGAVLSCAATAVPKMPVDGRCEDVIFFDGVFFEPSVASIFFVP